MWRPQSFLAVIAVIAIMVMMVTVVMMVTIVMMIAVVMMVAVPSCGWDRATSRHYANNT